MTAAGRALGAEPVLPPVPPPASPHTGLMPSCRSGSPHQHPFRHFRLWIRLLVLDIQWRHHRLQLSGYVPQRAAWLLGSHNTDARHRDGAAGNQAAKASAISRRQTALMGSVHAAGTHGWQGARCATKADAPQQHLYWQAWTSPNLLRSGGPHPLTPVTHAGSCGAPPPTARRHEARGG